MKLKLTLIVSARTTGGCVSMTWRDRVGPSTSTGTGGPGCTDTTGTCMTSTIPPPPTIPAGTTPPLHTHPPPPPPPPTCRPPTTPTTLHSIDTPTPHTIGQFSSLSSQPSTLFPRSIQPNLR